MFSLCGLHLHALRIGWVGKEEEKKQKKKGEKNTIFPSEVLISGHLKSETKDEMSSPPPPPPPPPKCDKNFIKLSHTS